MYSSLRVEDKTWAERYADSLRCAVTIKGFKANGEEYYVDILEGDDIKLTKVGTFYELSNKLHFDSAIPETFVKLEVQSVFYCRVENKIIILDQTLQKDALLIPEYASLDYSNVRIEKLQYFPYDSLDGVRKVEIISETNEPVDGSSLEYSLIDYSGNIICTGTSSGYKIEHSVIFDYIPTSVQLAELSISLEGTTLTKGSIILHPLVNNFSKENMLTISPEFIINKLMTSNHGYENE